MTRLPGQPHPSPRRSTTLPSGTYYPTLEGNVTYQDQTNLDLNLRVAGESALYTVGPSGAIRSGIEAAEPLSTGGLPCSTTADAANYSATTAEACGYSIEPLISTTSLPGGGIQYTYYEDGVAAWSILPPAGIQPAHGH